MIRNVGVTSALNIYRAVIQFALNVALAHFLTPSDFGQVAFVLPVTLFILLLGDFGITAAIVRGSATADEAGAAATMCLFYGAVLFAGVAILRALGAFATWPEQTPQLLLAFGLVALIAMGAIIPRAMMERSLAYGRLAVIETCANTSAFAAAVGAAWAGMGVWSFAVYHLTMQTIRSALFWWSSGGRITINLHWRKASSLMRFGGWVVAFNLVNYCARNFDNYIVGGLLGTGPLGLYALGYQVMLVPMMAISWPASGVLLSTLSRLRDRPDLMRESFLAMLGLAATITFPMMVFVSLRGGLVFSLLLPARWHDVGPVIARLGIAGALQSSTSFIGALFLIQGRVKAQFWLGVGSTVASLSAIAVAARLGGTLVAVTDTYVGVTLILSIVQYGIMARLIDVRPTAIASSLSGGVLIAAAGTACLLAAELALPVQISPLIRAGADILAFGGVTLGLLALRRVRLLEALSALRTAGTQALT